MEKMITRTFKYTDVQRLEAQDGKFVPVGDPIREYEGEKKVREPQYMYAAVTIGEEKLSLPFHEFVAACKKYRNPPVMPVKKDDKK